MTFEFRKSSKCGKVQYVATATTALTRSTMAYRAWLSSAVAIVRGDVRADMAGGTGEELPPDLSSLPEMKPACGVHVAIAATLRPRTNGPRRITPLAQHEPVLWSRQSGRNRVKIGVELFDMQRFEAMIVCRMKALKVDAD